MHEIQFAFHTITNSMHDGTYKEKIIPHKQAFMPFQGTRNVSLLTLFFHREKGISLKACCICGMHALFVYFKSQNR